MTTFKGVFKLMTQKLRLRYEIDIKIQFYAFDTKIVEKTIIATLM